MMKCGNCSKPADFIYQITMEVGQPYCAAHLPRFLDGRLKADLLKTTEEWEKNKQTALEILSPELSVTEEVVKPVKPPKKARSKKSS